MSALDSFKAGLKYIEPAFALIETIQKITGTGGLPAQAAIAAVDAAIKSFVDGVGADISPTAILADLAALDKSLASDDAAADAALAARFPATPPKP